MAGRLNRPTTLTKKKVFLTDNEFLFSSLNDVIGENIFMFKNPSELDIFIRGKNTQTNIVFLFDLMSSALQKKSEINSVLSKNGFPSIAADLSDSTENDIKVSVFCFENGSSHETIIDNLISQFDNEEIKEEYARFYQQLCDISHKPKNGKEQSYKNVLPALYSKDFGVEVFKVLFKTKYKIAIENLCGRQE